jgi:hypothetical protein
MDSHSQLQWISGCLLQLGGKAEGKAEGEARGEAVGIIRALQQVLGIEPTSLAELKLEQLTAMANDLQHQVRERGV